MEITTKNMRAILINTLLGLATVAAVFAAIGGGWALAKYTGILPLKKAKKALVIDETPFTVENIKAIGELATATWYDEMVIIVQKYTVKDANNKDSVVVQRVKEADEEVQDDKAKTKNKSTKKISDELVIIQKAHARVGINLVNLKPDEIQFSQDGKSVRITLPALECLDFIMNPTDTEVFSENGDWNLENLKDAIAPAEVEMKAKMKNDQGLFDTARKGAQEVVAQLFRAAGYESVEVVFASDANPDLKLPSAK